VERQRLADDEFTVFVKETEPRLSYALAATYGVEVGRESTPYGLIAAGLDADQRSMLWLSEDGRTFTAVHELPVGPEPKGYRAVNAIAFEEGWVIAVGGLRTDAGDQQLMWASEDGIEWQSVPLEGTYVGGAGLEDIAYRDSVFVAVGNHAFSVGNAGIPLVLRWESPTD